MTLCLIRGIVEKINCAVLFSVCISFLSGCKETSDTSHGLPPVADKLRLVSKTDFNAEWTPPMIMGREFWNILGRQDIPSLYSLRDTALLKDSGVSAHCILKAETQIIYKRIALREIEIYDAETDKNIAKEGVPSAWAENAKMECPEKINDGNKKENEVSFSTPFKKNLDQQGWFSVSFTNPRKVNKIILYHGYHDAIGYNFIPEHFCLQFLNENNKWQNIKNTEIKNNHLEENTIQFEPVKTNAIRLFIFSQNRIPVISFFPEIFPEIIKNKEKRIPLFLSDIDWRAYGGYFGLQQNLTVKKAKYISWEKENPDFVGFFIPEWDNEYRMLVSNDKNDVNYREVNSKNKLLLQSVQNIFPFPKSRDDAFAGLKKFYETIQVCHFNDNKKLIPMNCAWPWNHYSLEFGAGMTAIETTADGASIHRHQPQIAFARGAARQYETPWGWYMAYFFKYHAPGYLKTKHGVKGDTGISVSLAERDMYLAYLSGANFLDHESWPGAFFQDSDRNGQWEFSPHGKAMNEWYEFVKKTPDRGISYTPIAILLDFYHGWTPYGNSRKIWYFFDRERSDYMIDALMHTVFPWNAIDTEQEFALCNTPYGDIFDVLVANPPSGKLHLDNYKVVFLTGKINCDRNLSDKLISYVHKGGTLVINAKHVTNNIPVDFLGAKLTGRVKSVSENAVSLPDGKNLDIPNYKCEEMVTDGALPVLKDSSGNILVSINKYGKGNVILTTVDYLIPSNINGYIPGKDKRNFPLISFLMENLTEEVLPIKIDGDIEYGLNRTKNGWILYLINNRGILKNASESQRLNLKETSQINVFLNSLRPIKITELRTGQNIFWGENKFMIDIKPGDIKVLEIKLN